MTSARNEDRNSLSPKESPSPKKTSSARRSSSPQKSPSRRKRQPRSDGHVQEQQDNPKPEAPKKRVVKLQPAKTYHNDVLYFVLLAIFAALCAAGFQHRQKVSEAWSTVSAQVHDRLWPPEQPLEFPGTLDDLPTSRDARAHRLATAIVDDDINESHYPLMIGLYNYYTMLVQTGYWEDHEIAWPPQNSTFFDEESLRGLGFAPEVIQLMRLIPYPVDAHKQQNLVVPELCPLQGFVASYLGPTHQVMRDPIGMDVDDYMSPTMFAITFWQKTWIYRTEDSSLIFWNYADPDAHAKVSNLAHLPSQSTKEVLGLWIHFLYFMAWLPDRFTLPHATISTDRSENLDSETSPDWPADSERSHPLYSRRNTVNRYLARKQLFIKNRWAERDYNRSRLLEELQEFHSSERKLFNAVMDAQHEPRAKGLIASEAGAEEYFEEWQAKPLGEYEGWLERRAGFGAARVEQEVPKEMEEYMTKKPRVAGQAMIVGE